MSKNTAYTVIDELNEVVSVVSLLYLNGRNDEKQNNRT